MVRYSHTYEHVNAMQTLARGVRLPTFMQVVVWTSLLLDSRLSGIVLGGVGDQVKLLRALKNQCESQIALCVKMQGITGQLAWFLHRGDLPVAQIPMYEIETLRLY